MRRLFSSVFHRHDPIALSELFGCCLSCDYATARLTSVVNITLCVSHRERLQRWAFRSPSSVKGLSQLRFSLRPSLFRSRGGGRSLRGGQPCRENIEVLTGQAAVSVLRRHSLPISTFAERPRYAPETENPQETELGRLERPMFKSLGKHCQVCRLQREGRRFEPVTAHLATMT